MTDRLNSKDFQQRFSAAMAIVGENGLSLKDQRQDLQNNAHIVYAAVKQNGLALQYASDALKNNQDLVKFAVKQNGLALQYASDALKNDPDIVKLAVNNDVAALAYASDSLRSNFIFIWTLKATISNTPDVSLEETQARIDVLLKNSLLIDKQKDTIKFPAPPLPADRPAPDFDRLQALMSPSTPETTAKRITAQIANNLTFAELEAAYWDDKNCVIHEINHGRPSARFDPGTYCLAKIGRDGKLHHAGPLEEHKDPLARASERLRNDPDVVMASVLKKPSTIQYASDALRSDVEFIANAAKQVAKGYYADGAGVDALLNGSMLNHEDKQLSFKAATIDVNVRIVKGSQTDQSGYRDGDDYFHSQNELRILSKLPPNNSVHQVEKGVGKVVGETSLHYPYRNQH